MTDDASVNLSCHCGGVKMKVRLTDGLSTARRCNCSFCGMRGAVTLSAPLDGITIVEGAELLSLYSFNTGVAKHYFCARCGIYTHHHRRSQPAEYGVNLACIEGHGPFDIREIPVLDGQHHPSDGFPSRLAGTLRYDPA